MYTSQDKILELSRLKAKIASWRVFSDQIVFTNGCFDLLHLGHIDYLEKARKLGDRLVIGLNSDESVKLLKGDNRPIHSQETRSRILAAMEFIDAIVIFEEETPADLIKSVNPDILVKGGDYELKEIVGADFVLANKGKVEIIPFLEGHSSSDLIEKIKKA